MDISYNRRRFIQLGSWGIYNSNQKYLTCICHCGKCTKVSLCHFVPPVCEVVETLQLSLDRDPRDVVGDLSVCLDGMQVDPETFASAEKTGEEHKPATGSPG